MRLSMWAFCEYEENSGCVSVMNFLHWLLYLSKKLALFKKAHLFILNACNIHRTISHPMTMTRRGDRLNLQPG
jgi:hypothetical protein